MTETRDIIALIKRYASLHHYLAENAEEIRQFEYHARFSGKDQEYAREKLDDLIDRQNQMLENKEYWYGLIKSLLRNGDYNRDEAELKEEK